MEYRKEEGFDEGEENKVNNGEEAVPQFYDVEGRSIMHLHIATLAKEEIKSVDSFVHTRLFEFDRTMQALQWQRTNEIITIQVNRRVHVLVLKYR